MVVAGLVVIGVGVVLILAGAVITIFDWKDQRQKRDRVHPGLEGKELGLDASIGALEKLLIELAKHPIGTRLMALGIVCILIGGTLGGVGGLVES
jgi:predicted RND superfamily exporter protein